MNTFGDRLKYARKLHNMKQTDLAEKIDVSGSAIGGYERNTRQPSLELVGKIARELNVSADYLIGVSDNMDGSEKEDVIDLREFLHGQRVMFNGLPLTETDKQRITDILTGLFYYAKR